MQSKSRFLSAAILYSGVTFGQTLWAENINRTELNSVLNDLIKEEEAAKEPAKKEAPAKPATPPDDKAPTTISKPVEAKKPPEPKPVKKEEGEKKSFFGQMFSGKKGKNDQKPAPQEEKKASVGWFSDDKKTEAKSSEPTKSDTKTSTAKPAAAIETAKPKGQPAEKKSGGFSFFKKKDKAVGTDTIKTYANIKDAPAGADLYQNRKDKSYVDANTVPSDVRQRITRNPDIYRKVEANAPQESTSKLATSLAERQAKIAPAEKPASSNWFANLGKKNNETKPAEEKLAGSTATAPAPSAPAAKVESKPETKTAKSTADNKKSSWFTFFSKDEKKAEKKAEPPKEPAVATKQEPAPAVTTKPAKKQESAKSDGWFGSIFKKDAKPAVTQEKKAVPALSQPKSPAAAPVATKKSNNTAQKPASQSWVSSLWKKNEQPQAPKAKATNTTAQPNPAGKDKKVVAKSSGFDFMRSSRKSDPAKVSPRSFDPSRNIAVVAQVKGYPQGPFERQRSCTLQYADGSSLTIANSIPFSEGDILTSMETSVRVLHKNRAKLTLDKGTQMQLMNIEETDELTLVEGRVRLNVLEGGFPWIIHANQTRIHVSPQSDVVIDRCGDTTVRVSVLSGSVKVAKDLDSAASDVTAGQDVILSSVNEAPKAVSEASRTTFDEQLTLCESDDYPAHLQAAIGNLQSGKFE